MLELAGDEVDHGDEVVGGLEAAGPLLGGLDRAVETFGKSVGAAFRVASRWSQQLLPWPSRI